MINRTTDSRKESNSLQNSFVKFNYQNLKPMRKIVYSLMTIALLTSCSKLKKDTQTLAELKCLEYNSYGDINDRYEREMEILISKYNGQDLVELEKNSEDLFKKNCSEKSKDEKEIEEFNKQSDSL